jgi:hypothetical protein
MSSSPPPQSLSRLCYRLAFDLVCGDWLFGCLMRRKEPPACAASPVGCQSKEARSVANK